MGVPIGKTINHLVEGSTDAEQTLFVQCAHNAGSALLCYKPFMMSSIHVCTSLQVTGLLACSVEEIRRFSDRRHFHFSCGFGPEITCDLFSPRHDSLVLSPIFASITKTLHTISDYCRSMGPGDPEYRKLPILVISTAS